MSKTIWVSIKISQADARGPVQSLLVMEALKSAASKKGLIAHIEVQLPDGVLKPLSENPSADDILLLVGEAVAASPYAGLATVKCSVSEVLADAYKVIDSLVMARPEPKPEALKTGTKKIVAVTSCPTGIAHTFMAAEGLQRAAVALGYALRVETQGSVGAGTPLTAEEIAEAELVIIAADREVDRTRFGGKRIYVSGTKQAISDGKNFIAQAWREATLQSGATLAAPDAGGEKKIGPYKHLMTGVSFMLPFVVAGGLMIALAFAIGGINAGNQEGTLAKILMVLGGQGGFALMIPALAGYIAYSIADRPGIAPGMIGGLLCNIIGAGFLGGIVAGFVAGYGVYALNRYIPLPKELAGLKPVLILPLLGTLLTGLILYYVIGGPAAKLNGFLSEWLRNMQGTQSIVLGLLLGGMMALDMGGPVNKAAYAFSTGMLEANVYMPMAAVMAAGMTPPMAAALATRIFKNKFTPDERKSAGAAFVLGLAFVSEGAIPFAARDPLRVIPAFVIGSAVTGAMSMAFGINLMTPHGGIFVLPIPNVVSNIPLYALAIIAGTVISAVIMGVLKKTISPVEGQAA